MREMKRADDFHRDTVHRERYRLRRLWRTDDFQCWGRDFAQGLHRSRHRSDPRAYNL